MRNFKKLFKPKSIAIVGASPKKEKLGNVIMRNILNGGWKGELYFVNPKHKKIGSQKCHASLNDIRKPVDLVLVVIPAVLVEKAIEDGVSARPKAENYVIISAGFSETGKAGKKLEDNLKNLAEKHRLNILGPNCLGFISPVQKLNASFTGGRFKKGKVAVVSQSGALAVALLDWAENMSVGFSKVISIGNKTVLDECDIIDFLADDEETNAVALYLEDIRNGQKFSEAAKKIGRKKPLIIIKAGKSQAGQKAISSHTGSLAQDNAVVSAAFQKLNILEAKTIEEFQDLMLFLNSGGVTSKKEVIILTNAGGPGVLASDFIGKSACLGLKKIIPTEKSLFKKKLPENASVENPIDIIGDASPDRYEASFKIIAEKYPENPLLLILTPQTQTNPEKVARIIAKEKNKFSMLATSFMGGEKVEKSIRYLHEKVIPNFESPETALAAIEKTVCYFAKKETHFSDQKEKPIHLKIKVNSIIQRARQEKRKMLVWREAEKIFGSYGISLTKSVELKSPREIKRLKFYFPCALKTDDAKIMHRFDKKALELNIKNEKELKIAYQKIKKSTGSRDFLVQKMAKPGLEMIIGLKRDATFGPVVVVGWGGTMTEIFKDRIILIPPLTAGEIRKELANLKISRLFSGYRGERGYGTDEIVKIAVALQNIASENPDISEIDINPVVLYNNGDRYQILDAKIYL